MTEDTTLTARERLRIHLREARRTTNSPIVEAQLNAVLDRWKDDFLGMAQEDET